MQGFTLVYGAALTLAAVSLPSHAASGPAVCTATVTNTLSADAMKAMAKITMAQAQASAYEVVGRANVKKLKSGELEVEHGCLVYSFDIMTKTSKGIEEVMVDAVSGVVISNKHETPAQEAAEAAADKKKAAEHKK